MSWVKARLSFPNLASLIILWINGSPQLIFWQLQNFCQKFPCPRNSFLLEIIAEGEITQHFKISLMAGSTANILNITSTYTTLAGGNTWTRWLYLASKICLKRSHTSTNHQQSRVILRNQGCTWQSQMSFLLSEELKISFSQFITCHLFQKNLPPNGQYLICPNEIHIT